MQAEQQIYQQYLFSMLSHNVIFVFRLRLTRKRNPVASDDCFPESGNGCGGTKYLNVNTDNFVKRLNENVFSNQ